MAENRAEWASEHAQIAKFVTRPISGGLLAVTVIIVLTPLVGRLLARRPRR